MLASKGILAIVLASSIKTTCCVCPRPLPALGFTIETTYSTGKGPAAAAVGDLNGDGKQDIAVVNSASDNVSILLGSGDGKFTSATNPAVGHSPGSIAIADFNGDKKLDLVVANQTDGNLSVLIGNGDGTFQSAVNYSVGGSPSYVAAGDLNADGKFDLAVANAADGKVTVLLGNGDGTFQSPASYTAGSSPLALVIADFNGDSKADLAVADANGVDVLPGNGDGTFGAPVSFSIGGAGISIASGDFNADGKLDVVVAVSGSGWDLLLGKGDGTFDTPVNIDSQPVLWLTVGDFNQDGTLDVAAISQNGPDNTAYPPALLVHVGKGDGTFNGRQEYSLQTDAASMATGDFNNDHYTDLIVTHKASNNLGILSNSTGLTGADPEVRMIASPDPVNVGQDLNFTIFAGNRGPQTSSSLTLTIEVPNGLELVSQDCSGTGVLTCDFGIMQRGEGFVKTIDAVPTAEGTLTTSATITTTGLDLDLSNDTISLSTTVNPATGPTLTVAESGSGGGTVVSNPAGISCPPRCFTSFTSATSVTLSASPDSVSAFADWSGACSGTGSCPLNMTADKQVTATFNHVPQLQVSVTRGAATGTVTSSPAGINCPVTCQAGFASGTTINLTESPDPGAYFTVWDGACSGTGACSVTMNSDESVGAAFYFVDFSLSASSSSLTVQPGGQGTNIITLTRQGPFTSPVQLTCTVQGPSPLPACALSPASLMPGAKPATSTLTVSVPSSSISVPELRPNVPTLPFAAWSLVALLGFVLIYISERRSFLRLIVCSLLLALFLFHVACGAGAGNSVVKKSTTSYAVTITGTSGALNHTTQITVTVP